MNEPKIVDLTRKRVVIVDDSRTMQAILEHLFTTRMGYDVVGIVGDAEAGLPMIVRLRPDLMMIGLHMPYIDGRELLAIPNVCKVVISESASTNLTLKARLETLGANACIGKSEMSRDPDRFCQSIMSLVSNSEKVTKLQHVGSQHAAPAGKAVLRRQPVPAGYPIPRDERERLSALAALHLANDDADHQLDLLTTHLAQTTGFSACAMTFIDRDTQWTKSSHGIGRGSIARAQAVCNYTICGDDTFIVEDLLGDHRFDRLECVVSGPRIRSYVGCPIVASSGVKLGTICLLDTKPRRVTASELTNLRSIARIAAELIESRGASIKRAA